MFVSGPEGPFWDEPCPLRGAGLTHTKEFVDGIFTGVCADCHFEGIKDRPRLTPIVPVIRSVSADHAYRFTIAGRCGECQGLEDDHPIIGIPDPQTGCDVDHRSLNHALLVGADGGERSRCPRCGVQVEPPLARGFPDGRAEGRGRGYFTERHRNELAKLIPAWLAGDR